MDDHFTAQELRARGWTGRIIKAHLGKPDATRADQRGRLHKQHALYNRDRVLQAERNSAEADLAKLAEARALARAATARKRLED